MATNTIPSHSPKKAILLYQHFIQIADKEDERKENQPQAVDFLLKGQKLWPEGSTSILQDK